MSILYVLVPIALLLALAFVAAFIWSARGGQLDDLVTPAVRILGDDDSYPKRDTPDGKITSARSKQGDSNQGDSNQGSENQRG